MNILDRIIAKKLYGGGSGGGGDEADRVEVLAKCQPPFDDSYGQFVLYNQCQLEIGKNYIVDWNGTEYTGTAIDGSAEGFGDNSVVLVNDGADKETGEGIVFIITYMKFSTGDDEIHIIDPSGSDSLTIAIYQVAGGGTGGGEVEWIGDGDTHIWVSLREGRTSPMVGVCPNGTVTVDWGDGTEPDTLTGTSLTTVQYTPNHHYAAPGDYVITLKVNGTMGLYESTSSSGSYLLRASTESFASPNYSYAMSITKVEFGEGLTVMGRYALHGLYNLTDVKLPDSLDELGYYSFCDCRSLKSLTIPTGVTTVGNYAFSKCYALENVVFPTNIGSFGSGLFEFCYSLISVQLPSVNQIGESMFKLCTNLLELTIPEGVQTIEGSAFSECRCLESLVIPASVTSIQNFSIASCSNLRKLRFEAVTPPTMSASYSINDLPSDCVISVPTGTLSAYTSATNYPSSSTYTYIEED